MGKVCGKLIYTFMQIFGDVSGRLADSRKRIRTIKENLAACKRLLHCKRDELKERWLEGVEHKHVMLLLEQMYVHTYSLAERELCCIHFLPYFLFQK